MKYSPLILSVFLVLSACGTHRDAGLELRSGAPTVASSSGSAVALGRRSTTSSGTSRRKGETVTDSTQESRVLGVEAVVGGDAELRR
jgi:hypothetical protein